MSVAVKEQVIQLLSANVKPSQVALAVGCDPSYVSQLLADEVIRTQVEDAIASRNVSAVAHDDSIDAAEKRALQVVNKSLESGFMKPMEALKTFQVLNSARRRTEAGSSHQSVAADVVVTLDIPVAAQVKFKMTANKEVIDVEGRSMVTMPAANVTKMLRERQAKAATLELLDSTITDVPMRMPDNKMLEAL